MFAVLQPPLADSIGECSRFARYRRAQSSHERAACACARARARARESRQNAARRRRRRRRRSSPLFGGVRLRFHLRPRSFPPSLLACSPALLVVRAATTFALP